MPLPQQVRDGGRVDIYVAEDLAFEGTALDATPGEGALLAAVRAITGSGWWRRSVGPGGDDAGSGNGIRRVRVRPAADSHWQPATRTLALQPDAAWFVVTHELAHAAVSLSGDIGPPHGPGWRGWNAALVEAAFGAPFAELLAESFARHVLSVRRPAGVVPPPTPMCPIATPHRGGWSPGGRRVP